MSGITRRQLAALAAVSLASASAAPQAPPAADAIRDFEKEARESHKRNSAVLAQFEIPMSTEPAFQFKA